MNWNGIWYGRNLMRFQVEVSLYPGTGRHQTKVKFILPPSNCKVFPPYTRISEWWNKVWCRENNSAFLPCISLCTNINGTQLTIWLQCDLKIPENEKKYFPKCSLWIRQTLLQTLCPQTKSGRFANIPNQFWKISGNLASTDIIFRKDFNPFCRNVWSTLESTFVDKLRKDHHYFCYRSVLVWRQETILADTFPF